LYKRLLESRRRHADESWAGLEDALLLLIDKAYPGGSTRYDSIE